MFLFSSRECFGIERSGRFKIGMKEETEVWLILVLFFAIRKHLRGHNPVPSRGAVWVCSDTPILIYGYWYEIVSNMYMKQVVLCCYLLLYSRFGLGWWVWVTSPCWCVLRVHPCIVVEKKFNIIFLLLPGVITE